MPHKPRQVRYASYQQVKGALKTTGGNIHEAERLLGYATGSWNGRSANGSKVFERWPKLREYARDLRKKKRQEKNERFVKKAESNIERIMDDEEASNKDRLMASMYTLNTNVEARSEGWVGRNGDQIHVDRPQITVVFTDLAGPGGTYLADGGPKVDVVEGEISELDDGDDEEG